MRVYAHKQKSIVQRKQAHYARPVQPGLEQSRDMHSIIELQRTAGNQAVQRLLQSDSEEIEENQISTDQQAVESAEEAEPVSDIDYTTRVILLNERVKQQKARVYSISNDVTPPILPAHVTPVGETRCNPNTGKPEWKINKNKIPKCMWPCAELHEKTHVKFISMACERVWNELARVEFWLRITKQRIKQKAGKPKIEEAYKKAERATNIFDKIVKWYLSYHDKTCLYNEIMAYEAGNKLCSSAKIRADCKKNGETARYLRQLAAWRQFRLSPPSCPAKKAKP